jgi:hypothetical protein
MKSLWTSPATAVTKAIGWIIRIAHLLLSDGTHRKGNLMQKSPYLDLILVACSDVGDGPASLLLYAFLVIMGEKCQQTRKSLIINDKLVHQNAKCYNNGNTEEERDRHYVILENWKIL